MNKRERILAEKEGRKPSKLHDSDYLMGVYDETRMGGTARLFSKTLPSIQRICEETGTSVILINQVRDKILSCI